MDYRTKAEMLFGDVKDLKSNISSLLLRIQMHTDINLGDILTITRRNDSDPNIDTGTYPQHDILLTQKLLFIIITVMVFTVIPQGFRTSVQQLANSQTD